MSNALRGLTLAIALVCVLAGCGGGNSGVSTNPPTNNTPPETVQGIATPSSVSVVTATNAD
jgi:predicted small lipoprotein YifL